jgi:eukaryotic-like serine/threonine-protein kinase
LITRRGLLPADQVSDSERKRRFVREARAASALNHPNIITIYDVGSEGGIDFVGMEYLAGKTLDQLIPRKGLRLNETLKLTIQMADALAKAHSAGIVHRDLKPTQAHWLRKYLRFEGLGEPWFSWELLSLSWR